MPLVFLLTKCLTSKDNDANVLIMHIIKISSKRQATFPRKVCESLGIHPGDRLLLDRRIEDDREVWLLRPERSRERPWLGSLKNYAMGKDHSMEAVRGSIAKGRKAMRS